MDVKGVKGGGGGKPRPSGGAGKSGGAPRKVDAGAPGAAQMPPPSAAAAPEGKSKIGSPMSWNYKSSDDNAGAGQLICGDCGALNTLRPKDPVRCRDCGYRIMLKKRQRRCMVFLAR